MILYFTVIRCSGQMLIEPAAQLRSAHLQGPAPVLEYVLAIWIEEFSNYVGLFLSSYPSYNPTSMLSRLLVLIFLFVFSWTLAKKST